MGSTNKPMVFTVAVKVQMKKLINNLVTALEECDNFRWNYPTSLGALGYEVKMTQAQTAEAGPSTC